MAVRKHRIKQNLQRETNSVRNAPGLSTSSYISRIVAQPPPSFLCCPKATFTPSIQPNFGLPRTRPQHPSGHTVLIHSFHTPKPSQYSLIRSTLQLLLHSSSPKHLFIPNSTHSRHSNQTPRTLTLPLSAPPTPHVSGPHSAAGTTTPSYRHLRSPSQIPHCSALTTPCTPHSFCVPHPFHRLLYI